MKLSEKKHPELRLPDREEMIKHILTNEDPEAYRYTREELDAMGNGQIFSIYIRS
jgi:hypothetical protein